MLKSGLSVQRVNCRRGKKEIELVCSNPNYISDFSTGTDGWVENLGVAAFQGGVTLGGESAVLQVSFDNSGTPADDPSSFLKLELSFNAGCTYTWQLDYYINSANDEVTFVNEIVVGGTTLSVDSGTVPTNTWLTRTGTITPTNASGRFYIYMNSDSDTKSSDTVGFKNIKLFL